MGTPDPLRWLLVVPMIAVSGYHLTRLASSHRRREPVDLDLAHAAMAGVMAMMLAGRLGPDDVGPLGVVFAVPTAWFAGRSVHSYIMSGPRVVAAPLGQTIGSAAMVYMLAVGATARPMAGMSMSTGSPLVAGLLATALIGVGLTSLSRPSLGAGCHVAMSATAAYMLVAI